MARKRGLGRGLDALLGGSSSAAKKDAAVETSESGKKETGSIPDGMMANVAVDLIQRGKYQPRTNMQQESLEELADSIREQGVVQPIVVRPIGKDQYEIIAGERRWRAAQIAGLQEIPCIIRQVPDRAAIAMALIENIQRENLNPMEESRALQRLIDEFKMTHQQAAESVGRSRTGVTNLLRLQELEDRVKKMVDNGKLEMGHARCLLALKDEEQYIAAQKVVKSGLSVRETEQLVRKQHSPEKVEKKPPPTQDPDIKRLEDKLSGQLGAAVQIQHTPSGKGKLVIKYNSSDELDGILEKIK